MLRQTFDDTLDNHGFAPWFHQFWADNRHYQINYGPALGVLDELGIEAVGGAYAYNPPAGPFLPMEQQLLAWRNALWPLREDIYSTFLTVVEIFAWGKVPAENYLSAIALHRNARLRPALGCAADYFVGDDSDRPPNIQFSSGWTKVYAALAPFVAIYDSRVAAFCNHVLADFVNAVPNALPELLPISSSLCQLPGPANRRRTIPPNQRAALQLLGVHANARQKLRANLFASWLLRHLAERIYPNAFNADAEAAFRMLDKAFFMLGFDLDQL